MNGETRAHKPRLLAMADSLCFVKPQRPSLRPDWLRHVVHKARVKTECRLAKAFSYLPSGGPASLPPHLTVRYVEACWQRICSVRPGVPALGRRPGAHRARAWAGTHG